MNHPRVIIKEGSKTEELFFDGNQINDLRNIYGDTMIITVTDDKISFSKNDKGQYVKVIPSGSGIPLQYTIYLDKEALIKSAPQERKPIEKKRNVSVICFEHEKEYEANGRTRTEYEPFNLIIDEKGFMEINIRGQYPLAWFLHNHPNLAGGLNHDGKRDKALFKTYIKNKIVVEKKKHFDSKAEAFRFIKDLTPEETKAFALEIHNDFMVSQKYHMVIFNPEDADIENLRVKLLELADQIPNDIYNLYYATRTNWQTIRVEALKNKIIDENKPDETRIFDGEGKLKTLFAVKKSETHSQAWSRIAKDPQSVHLINPVLKKLKEAPVTA